MAQKRVVNLEPNPELLDRVMSAAERRRIDSTYGRDAERLTYSRLRCTQCETIYNSAGDVRLCMKWHRGDL